MKKISKNIISKSLLLLLAVVTQMQAWAFDSGDSDSPSKWSQAAAMPSFWIASVLFIACIVGFFLVGREKKERELQ